LLKKVEDNLWILYDWLLARIRIIFFIHFASNLEQVAKTRFYDFHDQFLNFEKESIAIVESKEQVVKSDSDTSKPRMTSVWHFSVSTTFPE
jgi:hypothetical protein